MKKGYTMFAMGKDIFFETDREKKTDKFAEEFIEKFVKKYDKLKLNIVNYNELVSYIKYAMKPCVMVEKTIENGNFKGLKYIELNGENFSNGTDVCKNPYDEIFYVK